MQTEQPISFSRAGLCLLLLLGLAAVTYPETLVVGSVKFALVWRAVFVIFAVVLIIARRPEARLEFDHVKALLFCWLWFCSSPILSLVAAEVELQDVISATAIRIFPLFAWLAFSSTRAIRVADLILRLYPIFLVLVGPLFLLGVLESQGVQTSLEAVAGVDVNAFMSVFQNVHSAGYGHAIGALLAFALAYRANRGAAWPYVLLGVLCLGLTAMTTARAGLLAAMFGLLVLWSFQRNFTVPVASVFLMAIVGAGFFAARPELLDVAVSRLQAKNQYVAGDSIDSFTSGRLGLQRAALAGYEDAGPAQQLFGMGRSESVRQIERRTGLDLMAHSAFIDELVSYGLFGLAGLFAVLVAAARQAWRSAVRGRPLGLALVVATFTMALFQGLDYSLQLSLLAMVLLIDSRRANRRSAAAPADGRSMAEPGPHAVGSIARADT